MSEPPEDRPPLVPRLPGYDRESVDARRHWVEETTGAALPTVGAYALDPATLRGNIENAIGTVQMPLGVAGPLQLLGEHARGTFYVPLATTEGALVRSYERGMVAISRAGGARAATWRDENRVAPVFVLADVAAARGFAEQVLASLDAIRAEAEATTRHGKLLRLECLPIGREVIVDFRYSTGDAQGMNMAVKATDRACRWIVAHLGAREYYVFSGYDSEKRASGALFAGGKGKTVVAEARLPAAAVRSYLHVEPAQMVALWRRTLLGHLQAAALGYNGHFANGLTALFIACGQDVANVANSAVGITSFEVEADGALYATVTLPALSVATVGGGTALGTSRECLAMLGCGGDQAEGGAARLAEIAAATLLAGELSFGAAIASGEQVEAHEQYGRNRPGEAGGPPAG
ncbi:MAG TPA: hydroxymethylglutaryl-CoA reductase [Thermoanaerobaculia bacterium]|jgi:hydroxymethylglutaryl-CoA reductase (NADPH)|nr:hydroxymethylglutaryl-CoA reductase [Thermoanaerobaculia bacterium]